MHAAVVPPSRRALSEHMATMLITIEADNVPLVQRAVISACGESVELLRTQAVPRSTKMRVWLVLTKSAATDAMSVIMKTVPYGEIGPVTPI
jgi:hypothetical protein